MQIKRTGVNGWDQKRVLPVSFASLVVPTKDQFSNNGGVGLRKEKKKFFITLEIFNETLFFFVFVYFPAAKEPLTLLGERCFCLLQVSSLFD